MIRIISFVNHTHTRARITAGDFVCDLPGTGHARDSIYTNIVKCCRDRGWKVVSHHTRSLGNIRLECVHSPSLKKKRKLSDEAVFHGDCRWSVNINYKMEVAIHGMRIRNAGYVLLYS